MCKKRTQTIMLVQLCFGIKFLTQGSFLSKIKPFHRSHMILWFLRFLSLERKNFFSLFVTTELAKWLITYEIYLQYTYSIINFVFSSTNKMAETDSCIWFSSSLPKPKFSLWFTDINKHIFSLDWKHSWWSSSIGIFRFDKKLHCWCLSMKTLIIYLMHNAAHSAKIYCGLRG